MNPVESRPYSADGSVSSGGSPAPGGDLERIVGILNVFLRYARAIVLLPLAVFVIVVVLASRKPDTYTSDARILTQGSSPAPAASGLAAQLGLSLGVQSAEGSPDYYNELVESRTFRRRLLDSIGTSEGIGRIEVKGTRAGMMRVTARARDPRLAQRVAEKTLNALDAFDRERRRARIAASREFTEERTAEARAEMLDAEARLEGFMERNRGYQSSPALTLRAERLRRDVAFRQELFSDMARAHEQARIDQLRDAPILTVLDPPNLPAAPDPTDALKRGLIGAVLALVVAIAIAFTRDFIRRQSQPVAPPLAEFAALRRHAALALRHPLRRGGRREVGRGPAGAAPQDPLPKTP